MRLVNAPPEKRVVSPNPTRFWWMAWDETSITQSVHPFASIAAYISLSCAMGGVVYPV